MQKNKLSFGQMFNLSFGFFGVQIAYALQSANISRIFATLGADPHQLSFFWILPPLMGMIVQPLIGHWSDRTWCRMGRRKPYLLVGAIVAVLVMVFLPNAGSLNFSQRLWLGLNGAMWFGLFSLIFLDTSINVAMQPFKMMVGDMVGEEQKTQAWIDAIGDGRIHLEERSILGIYREGFVLFTLGECRIGKHVGGDGVIEHPTFTSALYATIVLLVERPFVETDTHLTRINYCTTGGKQNHNKHKASQAVG